MEGVHLIGSLLRKINTHLMAYKKKRQSEVAYNIPSKIILSLSSSGGFFPMQ
jgi:hypothetical protein